MSFSGEMTAGRALALVRETTVVLGLTLFFPFVVHILPSWDDSPLGTHLLPIFYAPLGALLLGRHGVAILASLLAPWVNYLLTGHPVLPMAALLCLQLLVFLLIGMALHKREVHAYLIGPISYSIALCATAIPGTLLLVLGHSFPIHLSSVPLILLKALPGLVILGLIGYWFSRKNDPLGA